MIQKIFFLIFLLITIGSAQQKGQPHYLTPTEKELLKTYQAPVSDRGNPEPPPVPVRTMAEWEELSGLMITWASYYDILAQIVDYAQEEVTVYIVCDDSNQVKNYLTYKGVELKNLKFMIEDYNTVWCRDYGPWTAYAQDTDSLYIIDWIYNRPRPEDDVIPSAFAEYIGVPEYEATQDPDDLVHTGGNFMVDGHGTGFSSKLILEENEDKTEAEIDDIMYRYLGVDRYILMDVLPYDEIHHIDMHMKLLDEETLLVGQYPEGVADGPQIEANLQYILDNYQTCYGRAYRVVRIPMPPDQYGRYPDEGGDYRTYTNSVIVNKTVIVPTYEEQYDTTALRIYREAMPGYHIVGIDCNDIISANGAIHCITKEIGVRNPVLISHAPILQAYDSDETYPVVAQITTNSGVDTAIVYWSVDTTQGFTPIGMTATQNDSFYAAIPGQPAGTDVYYYISATSNLGRTVAKPLVAPGGTYHFTVEEPSALAHRGSSLPGEFILMQNAPNPFRPGVTDGKNQQTQIAFTLAQPGRVKVAIYDLQGRKVRTLSDGFQSAGKHILRWNGTNQSGQPVSAGVYIYTMQTNGQVLSRKMLVLP